MNLETVNITLTYEDLRVIERIITSGITENVTNYFNNGHTLQNYLDDNLDNLEMLSDYVASGEMKQIYLNKQPIFITN